MRMTFYDDVMPKVHCIKVVIITYHNTFLPETALQKSSKSAKPKCYGAGTREQQQIEQYQVEYIKM